MDFFNIEVKPAKTGRDEVTPATVYPNFLVKRHEDLMVRGHSFYAVWDEEAGLWSRDEYDVQRLVDADLKEYTQKAEASGEPHATRYLRSFESNSWMQFRRMVQSIEDSSIDLDRKLTFANTPVTKQDYVSKRLPYELAEGTYAAWDELVGVLYSVEERAKIEWAIGAIVSGDSRKIQKFCVLYGSAGTGKGTILSVINKLFEGYVATFEAQALGSSGGTFATEAFKNNPLVGIQFDGDLSKIQDNTRLNSITSHEPMLMNEKFKSSYTSAVDAFLFMGTNKPVKITDAKSGIIRRLIDIHPTGVLIPENHYNTLMSQVDFELGAIAAHCLSVYRRLGKNHYSGYRPTEMMLQTDVFFNFIEYNFDIFKEQDQVTLKQAYALYKEYCSDTTIDTVLPQYKFREELRNYFDEFYDHKRVGDSTVRSLYTGFNAKQFKTVIPEEAAYSLVLDESESLFDTQFAECLAQEAWTNPETGNEQPRKPWNKCTQTLRGLDTKSLHYVRVPNNLVVIDFDLVAETGEKSLDRNLAAASTWPPTYAELSKSGAGVHLHYEYDGDISELAGEYSAGIDIKTAAGKGSLRRKLTRCNAVPIATLSSGLPKKEKKMLSTDRIATEKGLRDLIGRSLRKEVMHHTKPEIDFILHILEEARDTGMNYDVRDLQPKLIAFANNSTNQSDYCLTQVMKMPWSNGDGEAVAFLDKDDKIDLADDRLVFYDVEVYPNLFVICWKFQHADNVVKMVNPSPSDVEMLFGYKLVGFNNRRYDNHILYAAYLGYTNDQLYKLSQKLISNDRHGTFGEAYGLSYADLWDIASNKQSLKKWQVDLGLKHQEMDHPWDEPVPDDLIDKIVEYCANDVLSTDAVKDHFKGDWIAREILCALSGLSMNDTTAKHTAQIIFGSNRTPQGEFVYTDLSEEFPGYMFDMGKSTYRGEEVGEGGYVYAEPGMYENVVELDIASMHPTTIEVLNLFGAYTAKYSELKQARLAIDTGDFETARTMMDGRLAPFLKDEAVGKQLSYALKIVINTVYGLTAAKFENAFRDTRNKDNIVAKRGALFMVDLKHHVQDEMGLPVIHIKTDSIKIANATDTQIEEIQRFGEKYGYNFKIEAHYEKFCLTTKADYIAREDGQWMPKGATFAQPYVFKRLFSQEMIEFEDYMVPHSVIRGAMYLDFAHNRPAVMPERMQFVGRTGVFVPVTEQTGGGILLRVDNEKTFAVTGTKGRLWLEGEMAQEMDDLEVDLEFFETLADKARDTISKFGNFEEFVK